MGNVEEGNQDVLSKLAKEKLYELSGGKSEMKKLYDLVMFCLPPGTGGWLAWGHVNGWASFYNNNYCSSISCQMHEVGHCLNLAHSGEKNGYGDHSGMMGAGSKSEDGPIKCYNAVKNYQLGWYDLQKDSIDPLKLLD